MIKVLELFAGIGACSKALERLGIEHEIVDAVEVDKYAIKSFNAVHGTSFEAQDIMEWDKDIDVDLIMHGSPCQDFSIAGRQAGGDDGSGTRSSLMYETLRIVGKVHPKFVIWENVKNLLSKKHRHNFDAYIESMRRLGYVSSFQVLNAKDYGIPQNRERVFTVSIREDVEYNDLWDNDVFEFPKPFPLEKRLKDILEDEVDESYFLSDERLKTIAVWEQRQKDNGRGFRFEVKTGDDIGRAVTTNGDRPCSTNYVKDLPKKSIKVRTANKLGYDEAYDGDGVDLSYPSSSTRRGRVGHGVAKTIMTCDTMGTIVGSTQKLRVRRLTPKECWRLMGFDDEDFEKAAKVNSNTQLYKQAGNSIVVNVLEAILGELLCK
jgi:DNA (cytosine-5)-methyltransferase 1